MKNKWLYVIAIVVIGVLLFLLDSSHNVAGKYQQQVTANEDTINTLRGELDSINTVLATTLESNASLQAEKDASIIQHSKEQEVAESERKRLREQITVLQTELDPLIKANPKLKALIDAYEASEAAATTQIAALEAERDNWKGKFEVSQNDCRALVIAGLAKDAALNKSIAAFQKCNNDLSDAAKTIAKHEKKTKALITTVVVETGVIVLMALTK